MPKEKLFAEFPPVSPEEWENAIKDSLKGADILKIIWKTDEGFEVKPFYTKNDIEDLLELTYYPNVYPYLRGYNDKKLKWQVIQNIDAKDLKCANEAALKALSNGADAVEFDIQNIDKIDYLNILLQDIDIAKYSLHFNDLHSYYSLAQLIKVWANEHHLNINQLKGSFNFDPFGFYLLNGEYYNSYKDDINGLLNLFQFVSDWNPEFKIININGIIYHNAGANIIQEIAFSLAQLVEYFDILTDNDIEIEKIIPRIRITFGIGSTYFLEIAKLRATRMLIAKILEAYGIPNENAKITIHSKTGIFNKTAYDAYNNMLRNTIEAMAAVIGGANEITILPHDITLNHSNDFSRRIARNVQIILREEAHFDKVIDPAGGSYLFENLSASISQHSWNLFNEINDLGGFRKLMDKGWIKNEVDKSAKQKQDAVLKRKLNIVGVNNYPNFNEQISSQLKKQLISESKNEKALRIFRIAEPFENLRFCTEQHVLKGNKKPLVYLLPFGDIAMRNARANFSRNFFGVAGYDIMDAEPYDNDEEMLKLIKQHNPDIIVLCSSDQEYGTTGLNILNTINNAFPNVNVVIAGNPTEYIEILKEKGVNEFIHIKSNILETLESFHKKLKIM
ncbi:MAG: methylmalonyl-CoA mutase family protein [Bacteroidales bacterium]|jgi:methylmalonyl-CoA mutase|nr:methylmalonyl-CoA mutase small subunit [Bacteroidales bacterium]MDI9576094.1 methylmalonyl-CoA mutase family protein [Bacteroidota bacterium]MDD2592841.1 methylmalonyl-CoA mutase family protein [Bacteroidales bacterium]MDD3756475.1 methylmalonyl-CoA mutase family protein [Bacteroidales bacterium]MDY0400239.1 methylmalonyl-CoA mutase family protein [Bacteroidales bacterium]